MIFQHTTNKVLSGKKTQTRRLCKPWDYPWYGFEDDDYEVPVGTPIKAVVNTAGVFERTRWVVGKTYSVQPARAKAGVARIELLSIRREYVHKISEADVKAEGFESREQFLEVWQKMHGAKVDCWALTFRLVQGGAK